MTSIPLCRMMAFLALFMASGFAQQTAAPIAPQAISSNHIRGTVMEVTAGTPDVIIILCDQATGLPLSADTWRPFVEKMVFPPKLITTASAGRGAFSFTNVPPGVYRLVAQKWTGPFKDVFEVHGGVIQLFGVADHVTVPSEEAEKIVLKPPGDGVLIVNMDSSGSGPLVVVSTQPPLADPILGFEAVGANFLTHAIGLNLMPYGRTTIVGVPRDAVHCWFFANDNSPGFASESYDVESGFHRAAAIKFVAGWSDARHDPPERLKKLADKLTANGASPRTLLEIDDRLKRHEQREEMRRRYADLGRVVRLTDGTTCTVGDLLALIHYDWLKPRK